MPGRFVFGVCGWGARCRENRLTSVCVSSAIHGGRLLSFACPKESNQRKRHPRGRGLPGIHARVTTQAGSGVRREHIRVLSSKWPASCRPPLRGFSSALLAAAERDPGRAERGSPCRRSTAYATRLSTTPHIDDTPHAVIPAKAGIHLILILLLLSTPLKPRRRADGSAACTARGRREGSRRFGCRPWMACRPNPSARSEPSPQARARRRGCRFLWLLSFGQAKESDRPPWMADETHTDVSRLSRKPTGQEQQPAKAPDDANAHHHPASNYYRRPRR